MLKSIIIRMLCNNTTKKIYNGLKLKSNAVSRLRINFLKYSVSDSDSNRSRIFDIKMKKGLNEINEIIIKDLVLEFS